MTNPRLYNMVLVMNLHQFAILKLSKSIVLCDGTGRHAILNICARKIWSGDMKWISSGRCDPGLSHCVWWGTYPTKRDVCSCTPDLHLTGGSKQTTTCIVGHQRQQQPSIQCLSKTWNFHHNKIQGFWQVNQPNI